MLQQTVSAAIDRELANLPPAEERLETTQPPGDVEQTLGDRLQELDAIGPVTLGADGLPRFEPERLGPDLAGMSQEALGLSLADAVGTAVKNNLSVQIAQLQPAINEADLVAAEAAFDAVFFSNADFTRTDEPTVVPRINGVAIGTPVSVSDQLRFDTGLRQPLKSGGEVSLSTDLAVSNNKTPGLELGPDPAYLSSIRARFDQPLLRGFGSEVNTSAIRLARNAERGAIQQLRTELLEVVAETEIAFWDLSFAWHELVTRQWLVEVGMSVRDMLERRRQFDTTVSEFSDAVARVEQRKADVIRARRSVRAASDRLKTLLNDPQITVGSEIVFTPLDTMVTAPINYNLRDAMLTAAANRPEIQRAILDIDDASIREVLADSQRLPLLNMTAEMTFNGLNDSVENAWGDMFDGDFVGYLLGLIFEVPIGNRAAEASYRQTRLQRSAAVIGYRRAVQDVMLDVKTSLRDVLTSYELIQATRSNRIAQAENLRALLAEEETLAALTPEFLNLKFQRQERLAAARIEEVQALVNFDQSVARLYRSMGIGLEMNSIQLEIDGEPEPDAANR